MPIPFRSAMNSIVLRTSMSLIILLSTVSLKTFYDSKPHFRSQKRIFSICFHAASPTRITENIDVRSPERKSFITVIHSFSLKIMIFRPSFIRNHIEHFINRRIVKSCCQTYCLRKNRCFSRTCNSM